MRDQRMCDDLNSQAGETATMEERWKRAAADLANYRRRAERELAQQRQREREAVLRDWLPVVDNLERALMNRDTATLESLLEGVQAVYRQATHVLGHYGVSRMQTVDTPFDPEQHEAIALAPGRPEGVILDEVNPGYVMHETTLRPAQVIVATTPKAAERRYGI
ncbi:nucleotide exchange factor GrpE [Candidatus Entotheonella palauensis]|uniref:nucleotide exchange factor GrpE n=1 Tax=Candidatus Entotheonella palauensis TaxID=93172 RepID=UPI000B7CC7EF|nr:nucleotide exchange factor GrpE [Candidatus Entotheonella palauensis]